MDKYSLSDMKLGWFIGDFSPVAYKTDAAEVAVKHYKTGDYDKKHYHKIATETTTIVIGRVKMNDIEYKTGDVLVIPPGEATDFMVLEPTVTVVVKIPGVKNDKYEV